MNPFLSFYLNFLRVYAALGVLLFHCTFSFFSSNTLNYTCLNINLGHKMVVIFFVLSGYVIAYSAEKKNDTLKQYLSDRFIRLYSVIIPALLFTFFLDKTGMHYAPDAYAQHINASGNYYVRYIIALCNLQQNWNLASLVSTNLPFWSIAYEFWYYILLGCFMFIKNKWIKYISLLAIMLFVGPKILLLLPVWLIGVAIYYIQKKIQGAISQNILILLFIFSFILINAYIFSVFPNPFPEYFPNGKPPLFFSSDFINDYYLGILVGINIFLATQINFAFYVGRFAKLVQFIANGTFTLYLFHYPLLVFISIFIPYDKTNLIQVILLIGLQFISLVLIGHIIEKSRFYIKDKFKFHPAK